MVMLAVDNTTQQRVAVKRIPLATGFKRNTIIGELLNHSMCSGHPHIIQLQVSLSYPAMMAKGAAGLHQGVQALQGIPAGHVFLCQVTAESSQVSVLFALGGVLDTRPPVRGHGAGGGRRPGAAHGGAASLRGAGGARPQRSRQS